MTNDGLLLFSHRGGLHAALEAIRNDLRWECQQLLLQHMYGQNCQDVWSAQVVIQKVYSLAASMMPFSEIVCKAFVRHGNLNQLLGCFNLYPVSSALMPGLVWKPV